MTSRPPPLPKNEEKHREEMLDRVEEGWLEEEWARTMPQVEGWLEEEWARTKRNIAEELNLNKKPNRDSHSSRYRRNTMGLTCSKMGAKKKPSQFKLQGNEVGLIFRSALPEDLEWDTLAEDVALSLDAIERCLSNMLVALNRDTPQTKQGLVF